MHDWWRWSFSRLANRLRTGGRRGLLWSLRITVAATASYIVATLLFPGSQPLLAPLTAMLVVQVTPVSLLASGLDRVISVVAGVSLAVAFGTVVPLEWWSLGLLIFISITIGQVLRLRANLIEVAISAMLVLGVGSLAAGAAAWERIAETLVGAAVGIAANLLFPPKVASADAGHAIDGLADSVSDLLTRAADEIERILADGGDVAAAGRDWLGEARRINHDIPRVGAALLHAEQSRRLNVRAVGTPNVGPGLRQGLEALEHAAVAIRGMFRALVDALQDPAWPDDERGSDILLVLAATFRDLAASVDAFGQVVREEALRSERLSAAEVQGLHEALQRLQEARARLDELLLGGATPELLELVAAMLSTIKRLLREMDLDERIRRQVHLTPAGRPRLGRPGGPREPSRDLPLEPTPEEETQVLPRFPGERPGRRRP